MLTIDEMDFLEDCGIDLPPLTDEDLYFSEPKFFSDGLEVTREEFNDILRRKLESTKKDN